MKQFLCTIPAYPSRRNAYCSTTKQAKHGQFFSGLKVRWVVCLEVVNLCFQNAVYFPGGNGKRWPRIFLMMYYNTKPVSNHRFFHSLRFCSSPGKFFDIVVWFSWAQRTLSFCKTVPGSTSSISANGKNSLLWVSCRCLFVRINDILGNIHMPTRAQVVEYTCSLLLPTMDM